MSRLNAEANVQHRAGRTSPSLTQDQRLAWIRELLTGSSESLPYRVAGMLLLLYAQPLVKVVTLELRVIDDQPAGMSITLGQRPTDVPAPVNLLGARNRAIGELVLEAPPSLVADALGYSAKVAFLHADKAAEPWARYAGRQIDGP
jgi:hypothetical protein